MYLAEQVRRTEEERRTKMPRIEESGVSTDSAVTNAGQGGNATVATSSSSSSAVGAGPGTVDARLVLRQV